jgi:hypothetical protein
MTIEQHFLSDDVSDITMRCREAHRSYFDLYQIYDKEGGNYAYWVDGYWYGTLIDLPYRILFQFEDEK